MSTRRPKDKGRCTGGCCERFYLPYSPEELMAKYDAWKRQSVGERIEMVAPVHGRQRSPSVPEDIHIVALMVKPLFPVDAANSVDHVLPAWQEKQRGDYGGWWYTCKHYDRESRNCTIYEQRPAVCREYPSYGRDTKCFYANCTWGKHRADAKPPKDDRLSKKLEILLK